MDRLNEPRVKELDQVECRKKVKNREASMPLGNLHITPGLRQVGCGGSPCVKAGLAGGHVRSHAEKPLRPYTSSALMTFVSAL